MYYRIIIAIVLHLVPAAAAAQEVGTGNPEAIIERYIRESGTGFGCHGDSAAALDALRTRARQGDAEAALLLGRMIAEGRAGAPGNREAGLAELRRAALVAQPDALAYIGFRFLFHDSFPGYDPAEARRWFAAAADRGSVQGEFGMGLLHKHGRGVPQSDSAAATWFRRAADGGYAPAQLMLAALHDNPSSPLYDPAAAEQAFAALHQGGREALIRAWADAYTGGAREWYPVPVDHQEASRLRRRALRLASSGGEEAHVGGIIASDRQP